MKLFYKIPIIVYLIFAVIMIVSIVVRLCKNIVTVHSSDGGVYEIPENGWLFVNENIKHAGVCWKLKIHAPDDWIMIHHRDPGVYLPLWIINLPFSKVSVDHIPICPKCFTELEEWPITKCLYIWNCIKCAFRSVKLLNIDIEFERAKKIARKCWEDKTEKDKASIIIHFLKIH